MIFGCVQPSLRSGAGYRLVLVHRANKMRLQGAKFGDTDDIYYFCSMEQLPYIVLALILGAILRWWTDQHRAP